MIVGVIVVIALLVTRLREQPPELPSSIALPPGAKAVSFTQGPTWYAIVTSDDRILVYNRTSGALVQEVDITAAK